MGNVMNCTHPTYDVLVLGAKGAGKSSLIARLVDIGNQSPPGTMPASPSNNHRVRTTPVTLDECTLLLREVPNEQYQQYSKFADALVYVVDSTLAEEDMNNELQNLFKILTGVDTNNSEVPFENVPVVLVLNKSDQWMKSPAVGTTESMSNKKKQDAQEFTKKLLASYTSKWAQEEHMNSVVAVWTYAVRGGGCDKFLSVLVRNLFGYSPATIVQQSS